MPEKAEVFTISNSLNKLMNGRYILEINRDTSMKVKDLDELVLPAKVEKVYSKGKKIIIEVSNEDEKSYIVISLLMTGLFKRKRDNGTRAEIKIGRLFGDETKGGLISVPEDIIYYSDVSKYGIWKYSNNLDYLEKLLGPDIMLDDINFESWNAKMKKYLHKTVRWFLMEQRLFSGIGNYMCSDICYLSRVHPHRLVETLTNEERKDLLKNSKGVAMESLKYGGLSLRDYMDIDGSKGKYECAIYGKTSIGKNKVEKILSEDGRFSWVCPVLQKL